LRALKLRVIPSACLDFHAEGYIIARLKVNISSAGAAVPISPPAA